MEYIVFDLEWNQSPSGKEDSVERLPFEIIEIGAVKLDDHFKDMGTFHRLIKPQVYKKMHFKISEVTHMDMGQLRQEGECFTKVMEEFFDWCGGNHHCFCTWGSMDLTELQRNMAYHGVEIPFERPLLYYDIQKLYCLQHGDGKTKISLDLAAQMQGLEGEGPFHRALNDAYYTGRILSVLDMDTYGAYLSVDYYRLPQPGEEEYRLYFPDYAKFVSKEFDTREDIMKDRNVTDVACLKCSRLLRKKLRWFPYGQRFYFCLAYCPEHGYVKGKIRVKKSEDDHPYAVKTIKMAGEDDVELLCQKKQDSSRRRGGRVHQKDHSRNEA